MPMINGIYRPDIQPPEQPGWLDMGEDQSIDFAPAASAFKQRFMSGGKLGGGSGGPDAGGGAPTTWPGGPIAPKGGGVPGKGGLMKSL